MPKKSTRAIGTSIFVNGASIEIEPLNAVAVSQLEDRPVLQTETLLLLPAPSDPHDSHPPPHVLFTPATTSSRTAKRPFFRGTIKKAAKRQRLVKPKFDFYLVSGTDERIQRDLLRIVKFADEQSKAPFQVSVPVARSARMVPAVQVSQASYRQLTFLDALAPCVSRKSSAPQDRFSFLSLNIEELGYYGLLVAYEDGAHDILLWLGGEALDACHFSGRPQRLVRTTKLRPQTLRESSSTRYEQGRH
ncbi:hypothetical protein GN958_ATG07970 [Phytophthora infestans]|uniref:Uncharacterized protein n=1 Tax=Phytophthora infestans TaxID=4787 RepID=A0A8S9UQT7_PHYIN|nr:hypothetical protein GN958_ATG07970 [Phytophthora infestans]